MDRGLEKINELTMDLALNKVETGKIQKKIELKTENEFLLYQDLDSLIAERKGLEEEKKALIYKQKNIKKWKIQTILFTVMVLALMQIIPILLIINVKAKVLSSIIALISYNLLISPACINFADIFGYRSTKKYLKNHNMKDLEKEIEENEQDISLIKQKLKVIKKDLDELSINKQDLENNINLLSKEIEKIKDIRNNIINEYLESSELENLLNVGYDSFDEEKNKQNTKKK